MLATVRLPSRASVIHVNASFKTQAVALAIVNINRVASKHIVNPWRTRKSIPHRDTKGSGLMEPLPTMLPLVETL